jgi:hypothetical protein
MPLDQDSVPVLSDTAPLLDAGHFVPSGPDVMPFGLSSDAKEAIAALRLLADAMENGRAVVAQAQTGKSGVHDDFVTFRVFLEYKLRPW